VRVAIIGLPSAGKTTVYQALTGRPPASGGDPSVAAVAVPDERVDRLSGLYSPKKTTHATVEFVDLPGSAGLRTSGSELGQGFLNAIRPAHALLHVVDAFSLPEVADESVAEAIEAVDAELAIADLDQVERRLDRLNREGGGRSGPAQRERELLEQAAERLGRGWALRHDAELAGAEELRSFSFLTAKPLITVVNTDEGHPDWSPEGLAEAVSESRRGPRACFVSLAGSLEAEIAELEADEARDFLADYGIEAPARERVIQTCYDLLGLQSFFTVGPDEVRAWTVRRGASAQEGAGVIHSDIARGFIRAEVVDYDTVVALGSFEEAKKKGKMRLEGKAYPLAEGDVVSYRFNV
jgi:GTP-binding protein YchF